MKRGRYSVQFIFILTLFISNGLAYAQSAPPPRPVLPPRPLLPEQEAPKPAAPKPIAPKPGPSKTPTKSNAKPNVVLSGLKNGPSVGGGLNLFYYNMTPSPKYNGSNLDKADSFIGITLAFRGSYIWNRFIFHFDYMEGSLKNGKGGDNPKRGPIDAQSAVIIADYLLNMSIIGMRPFAGGGMNRFAWKYDGTRGFVADSLVAEGGLLYPITHQVFTTLYAHLSPFLNTDVAAKDVFGNYSIKVTSYQLSLGASINYIF